MPVAIGLSIGFDIADGEHVLDASTSHWALMQKMGVTEMDRKAFVGLLDDAREERDKEPLPDQRLHAARRRVEDDLGNYRAAAGLYSNNSQGRNVQLARDLRVSGGFPRTDARLKKVLAGIDSIVKEHAGHLAARGFSKEEQARFVEDAKVYLKLLHARGRERGEARKARLQRDQLFEALRRMTAYFRRAGRTALRKSPANTDFDKVARTVKPAKKVPPAAVPAQQAAQAVAGSA